MSKLGIDSAAQRAADAWTRINDKPSSVQFLRDDTAPLLVAQTVRIEFWDTTSETQGAGGGNTAFRNVTIFGVRGHSVIADTDIERGDKFEYNGRLYRVVDVITSIGEIQANAEVMS